MHARLYASSLTEMSTSSMSVDSSLHEYYYVLIGVFNSVRYTKQ